MIHYPVPSHAVALFLVGAIIVLPGCGEKNTFVEPPPPKVTVTLPRVETVTTYRDYPGRVVGEATVEIRARVSGILERKGDFEEGNLVDEKEVLYRIEQAPYLAAQNAAQAEVEKAEAALAIAKNEANRMKNAYESTAGKAVSILDVETTEANVADADAYLKAKQAAKEKADIDVGYTMIEAPLSGRISRSLVDVGNLVGGSEMTLLATIVNDDPVRFYFEVDEREVLQYLGNRPTAERPELDAEWRKLELKLELGDGSRYDRSGHIDFADNRIDPDSGTMQIQATFPNPDARLADGLFARVLVPREAKDAIMVPRASVQRDMRGTFVLVVDPSGTVVRRNVETGAVVGELHIIESGLEAGERVIVDGIQGAREGGKVTAVDAPVATPAVSGETTPGNPS